MSILIKPNISVYDSLKLATMTAVSVLEGIVGSIKWINDIYIQNKKIAGILCESSLDIKTGNVDYMVIGIGINVHNYDKPEELKDIEGSIEDFTDLNSLDYLDIYRKHSYVLGKKIRVILGLETFHATAIDIDDKGGLIIEKEDKTRLALITGEVSIRRI